MVHESNKEEYQEKAALYALGALSQLEARAFEHHIADGCPLCEGDLRAFEDTVAAIALDSAEAAPGGELRDKLLARIERDATQSNVPATGPRSPSSFVVPSRSEPTAPVRSPSAARRTILPWAVAAALAVGMLASLFTLNRISGEFESLRTQVAATRNQSRSLEASLNELAQVNQVLRSPGHREIALAGQSPSPSASARVYWDVQNGRWVVTADLPPPPQGKVYQLWFVTADEKVSAGLIGLDEKGHGFAMTSLPPKIGSIAAAAITLEPEGGSTQPTMPIYALGLAG